MGGFIFGLLICCFICLLPGNLTDGTLNPEKQTTKKETFVKEKKIDKAENKDYRIEITFEGNKLIVVPSFGKPHTMSGVII